MNGNLKTTVMSSLVKLYHGDSAPSENYTGFSMLANERKSFQLAVECQSDFTGHITVKSDFNKVNVFSVNYIHSDLPANKIGVDDYYRKSDDGFYPDLLLPIEDAYSFKKGMNVIWVEVATDNDVAEGTHTVKVEISDGEEILSHDSLTVDVIDCRLDFKDFIYTNWFHTDCLMSYYKIEAFSDEYWRIVKNYLKTANEYGMNCVLTPLFTPPLDTEVGKERPTVQLVDVTKNDGKYSFNFDKLTKWIDTAHECGMEYFEMSHFFTQWGARHAPKVMATVDGEYKRIFGWETKSTSREYLGFLHELSKELKPYLESRGLKDKVILHVSDEPYFNKLIKYTKASKAVHKYYKGYKIADATSEYKYYRWGIITTPIPASTSVHKFIGKTDELWTYYCCSQHRDYVSNRFFSMPSVRNRILGYQMYKYNVKGFLHWGYNFWYTQFSKAPIDPYKVSDAGGKFPSGDPFVVYPKEDGTAYVSLRFKVFYDALQDMAALNALEKLAGREKALSLLDDVIEFTKYPHSDEWMLETREKINKMIKENKN